MIFKTIFEFSKPKLKILHYARVVPAYLAKTMPSSAADNATMAIGEIADYLKVTERTIYRLAGTGQIPAFKVGGKLAIFQSRY